MKRFKFLILIMVGLLIMSCSEDYLETRPTQFTNAAGLNDIAEFDPSIFDGVLAGVYVTMNTAGSGGTTRHDDLGQKGMDIFSDMMSSDMVLGGLNYGWYRGITDYSWIEDESGNNNYQLWRFYYRIIRGANAVIDAQGGNNIEPTDPGQGYVIGQAKALRAYAYLNLAQFLQPVFDPNEKILPLYTEASLTNTSQSTQGEIYAQIEDDLTKAVSYLDGYIRDYPFQINKYVAEGLLAYAYAAQGKYDKALTAAKDVVEKSGFSVMTGSTLTGGFNDVYAGNWMWGMDITADMRLNLASWWGQMDPYTYSYSWAGDFKAIDEGLYNAMDASDQRRAQFDSRYRATNKFYNPDLTIGGTSSDFNEMDYIYMRYEEFVLLAAEAAYHSGDESSAKMFLKMLVSNRVSDASYVDQLSGQALMDEISFQTRVELFAEGKSYFLMKRNKQIRTRGSNHLIYPGQEISYSEPRVSFLLPLSERQNNPFIN